MVAINGLAGIPRADAANVGLWSAIGGALGGTIGVVAKTIWDTYAVWKASITTETWTIRASQLDKLLSEFYWPLYIRLKRDDVIWKTVSYHLKPEYNPQRATWTNHLSDEMRKKLAEEVENKIIIPNQLEAVAIIRSGVYAAKADKEFLDLLTRYVRHVDAYASLRSCGIKDIDPIDVDEPYPQRLSDAVYARLEKFQEDYDNLVREKGIRDFEKNVKDGLLTKKSLSPDSG